MAKKRRGISRPSARAPKPVVDTDIEESKGGLFDSYQIDPPKLRFQLLVYFS